MDSNKKNIERLIESAGCKRCRYYHGETYNNNYLNCTPHPDGPVSYVCSDREIIKEAEYQKKYREASLENEFPLISQIREEFELKINQKLLRLFVLIGTISLVLSGLIVGLSSSFDIEPIYLQIAFNYESFSLSDFALLENKYLGLFLISLVGKCFVFYLLGILIISIKKRQVNVKKALLLLISLGTIDLIELSLVFVLIISDLT